MSTCVIDGHQCSCQPDEGIPCRYKDAALLGSALIAERDALKARVADAEKELKVARAENDAHETQDSVIIQNYFDMGRELGIVGSPFDAMVALRQRAEAAESSLAASRRQVEGLKGVVAVAYDAMKEAIKIGQADVNVWMEMPEGEAAIRHEVFRALDMPLARVGSFHRLSTIDAPQEPATDPRDAIIAEAIDRAHYATGVADLAMKHRDDAESALAEAVEVMRPFAEFSENNVDANGWTSNIYREPIRHWFGPSEFAAVRAFVEKHAAREMTGLFSQLSDEQKAAALAYNGPENIGTPSPLKVGTPKPPAEMTEEELLAGLDELTKPITPYVVVDVHTMFSPEQIDEALAANPLPEELARPVTEEESYAAWGAFFEHKGGLSIEGVRAALEAFLAGRAKR